MTNGNRATGSAPPYVSYKSWDTFIAYLRTNLMPVPDRLDTSVWRQSPFSGSTKSGLQGALTFLGLTDPDGNTLGRLTNLADADTPEASRRILTSIYEERYAPVLGTIDPARATRQQIHEAFRNAGSANATAEKAVSFFVNFAREAGLDVHPNLFARGQGTRTRRKTAPNRNGAVEPEKISESAPKIEIEPENAPEPVEMPARGHDGVHPSLLNLLEVLPRDGQTWTSADREKLKLAFNAILDLAYPTIDDAGRRML